MILILLLVSACFCMGDNQKETEKVRQKMEDMMTECLMENRVGEDEIKELLKIRFYLFDVRLSKYLLCFALKMGYLNEDGDIQRDKVEHYLSKTIKHKDVLDKIIDECIIQEKTPEETIASMSNCMLLYKPKSN